MDALREPHQSIHVLSEEELRKEQEPKGEMALLTDMNGKDTDKAIADLKAHKLPHLFSHRQCYFVGCQAQIEKCKGSVEQAWQKGIENGLVSCAENTHPKIVQDESQRTRRKIFEEIEQTFMSGGVHPRMGAIVIKTPRMISINEDEWQALKDKYVLKGI